MISHPSSKILYQINTLFTTTYLPSIYLQYLGQQKLSKQNMKQVNTIHVTLPLLKEKKVL